MEGNILAGLIYVHEIFLMHFSSLWDQIKFDFLLNKYILLYIHRQKQCYKWRTYLFHKDTLPASLHHNDQYWDNETHTRVHKYSQF